jgi:hypothetical protein
MGIPKRSPTSHSNLKLINGRGATPLLKMGPSLMESKVEILPYDDQIEAL